MEHLEIAAILGSDVAFAAGLAALVAFLVASVRLGRFAWSVLGYALVAVIPSSLLAGWWSEWDTYRASRWTQKVTIYPVSCDGHAVFSKFCCGNLGVPLNPTTFA